ncbi:serine/threonine protein kinase [Candidatus Micrarchaeota archaeon]|nr:serine/threonine protein kinase [Candidatus Micrarchaeota archaeon]
MEKARGGQEKPGATRVENHGQRIARKNDISSDPLVGAVMTGKAGRYSIQEPLDSGGMGKVYTALDQGQNTIVVKVISPNFIKKSNDDVEKIVERFFREARAAAMVDHPNVIRIIDVGSYKETVFCVMEYLKGMNLEDMAKKHRPSWEWLAPVMMDVCDGVDAAHRSGIIHRDLSPDNIFLADIGGRRVVKVLDFGLAKFTRGEDDGLTKTGFAMGKITYMSPEQAEKACGQRGDYDHRVDIYAMGVIMYRLLTGVPPFKGENDAESLFMRLNVKPMRPSEINPAIPPEAEEIIMKAMARNEKDRFQGAAELKAAIASARKGRPGSGAKPESDDMFLGDILKSMERQDASAPKAAVPPQIRIPDEEQDPDNTYAPSRRIEKRSGLGRFAKWTFILSLAASAAYAAYSYRDEINRYIHDVRARSANSVPSAPRTQESAAPGGSAQPLEGYLATMSSTPSGASVYEVKGGGRREYLGTTPLVWRFPDENEHTILYTKRGYVSKRLKVSRAQPTQHLNMDRQGRPQAPSVPQEPGQGGTLPDEGTEEAPVE